MNFSEKQKRVISIVIAAALITTIVATIILSFAA